MFSSWPKQIGQLRWLMALDSSNSEQDCTVHPILIVTCVKLFSCCKVSFNEVVHYIFYIEGKASAVDWCYLSISIHKEVVTLTSLWDARESYKSMDGFNSKLIQSVSLRRHSCGSSQHPVVIRSWFYRRAILRWKCTVVSQAPVQPAKSIASKSCFCTHPYPSLASGLATGIFVAWVWVCAPIWWSLAYAIQMILF